MNTVLIDTMYIEAILIKDEPPYTDFADAIDDGKIIGISSTVSLTELIKNLGMKDTDRMKNTIRQLKSSEIILVNVTQKIASRAGELRLRYNIPTVDSLIAATGVVENVRHILTDDDYFDPLVNLIKPIDMKMALKLAK
ncbi:MAG: PIN domain-containing protein [Candidatus Methanoperedens sp.]|nr:PIN domain-containing protein [Candidatus Methanoperedens sp.]MCZ7404145.1 PIN domain-containing protein [Candidatus Methanoperedens sp.]